MLTVILLAATIPLLILGLDPLQWDFLETTLGIKKKKKLSRVFTDDTDRANVAFEKYMQHDKAVIKLIDMYDKMEGAEDVNKVDSATLVQEVEQIRRTVEDKHIDKDSEVKESKQLKEALEAIKNADTQLNDTEKKVNDAIAARKEYLQKKEAYQTLDQQITNVLDEFAQLNVPNPGPVTPDTLRKEKTAAAPTASTTEQYQKAYLELKAIEVRAKTAMLATPEKVSEFMEQNKDDPDVVRAKLRSDQVVCEIPKLEAALDKLSEQIKTLKDERAEEKNLADKKNIETRYKEVDAQKKMLSNRLAQLKAYKKNEDEPLVQMILNRAKLDQLADGMKSADDENGPAFDGLRAITKAPNFTAITDFLALKEANLERRDRIKRSSQRVIRAERIYPNEPEVTELSQAEHDALKKMLDVAGNFIDRQEKAELVTAAHQEVDRLWMEFIIARKNALPPAPEKPTEPDERLTGLLGLMEAQVLELQARGHPSGRDLEKERVDLLNDVAVQSKADNPDFTELDRKVEALAQKITQDLTELPTTRQTKATQKAKAISGKLNEALVGLYRTEKIKDPSKIEDPIKDWGTDGPPDDLIPLDQVITVVNKKGQTEYYQIDTRTEGGKDVDRRKNKGIPREMMAHLRNRAETLTLMSQTMAEGCDGQIEQFAKETEELLTAVTSTDGIAAYKRIQEIIETIDKSLVDKPLNSYFPTGLTEAKRDYDEFKKKYQVKTPGTALAEAEKHLEAFDTLKTNSQKVRDDYHALDGKVMAVNLDLSSALTEAGFDDGDEIGTRMGRLFSGAALKLAKKAKNLDPDVLKRIEDAQDKMMQQVKAKTAGANTLEGKWRKNLEQSFRIKEAKTEDAVGQATTLLDDTLKEINEFKDKLDKVNTLKGDDLVAFLTDLAAKMEDGAKGAAENTELETKWKECLKDAKKLYKQVEKAKPSGRTNSETHKSRLKGLDGRIKATEKQVEKYFDRKWGIERMDEIKEQLGELYQDVTGDSSLTQKKISDIKAKDRAQAIKPWLDKVIARAKEAADSIAADADENQRQTHAAQIKAAREALKMMNGLPDPGTLVSLCTQIDAKRDDKNDTYEKKLQRREWALAELNRLRRAFVTHPAVVLYRGNPFGDQGRTFQLVMGAFHRAEIGILVSVDPRAA